MTEKGAKSWWIWVAWREQAEHRALVYGCAAKSSKAPAWRRTPDNLALPSGARLHIVQATADEEQFRQVTTLMEQGQLDLRAVLGPALPEMRLEAQRIIIQEALGQTAARTRQFHPIERLSDIVGPAAMDLGAIAEAAAQRLGLSFTGSYAARLGIFEIFDLRPWLDGPAPFLLESDRPGPAATTRGNSLTIARTEEFAQRLHFAHVVCRVDGNAATDELVVLEPGQLRSRAITPAEAPDEVEFRLFDADGALVHHEAFTYLREINLTMAVQGRSVEIDDSLSRQARSVRGGVAGNDVSVVRAHTSQVSRIQTARQDQRWRSHAEALRGLMAQHRPEASDDRWFERGINEEVQVIAYFNRLLSDARVRAAILVDPYFGQDALQRLVLRLQSQGLVLTILTSLTDVDPDTGEKVSFGGADLERALKRAAPFLNPRLRVINLVDGPRRAFHDRYLLVYPLEGHAHVYLLSNSLNRMAGSWPFCMSRLAGNAAQRARRYIEGLVDGKDITNTTRPRIAFEWPAL